MQIFVRACIAGFGSATRNTVSKAPHLVVGVLVEVVRPPVVWFADTDNWERGSCIEADA